MYIRVNYFIEEENYEFNIHICRYRPEELHKLALKTKFSRKEIKLMYRGFKQVISQISVANLKGLIGIF